MQYIIKKRVNANSIGEALLKEKKSPIVEIWQDQEAETSEGKSLIGFEYDREIGYYDEYMKKRKPCK